MKSLTITKPTEQEAVATFQEELARIVQERARQTSQIERNQAELATLAERAREREARETAAQENIDNARSAYQEAQLRAELLTAGELAKAAQKDLSKLEGQLRAAQEAQMKLLSRLQQEEDADDRKACRLQEDINRAYQTIEHLAQRQQIAESLKEKALSDQAESILNIHLSTIQAMQAQRDQQQAILASMEEEIDEYVHRALQELASFPEQQSAFSAQFVYNDALTGILQGQINMIDLVLATGRGAEIPLEVARKAGTYWQGLAELLSLDPAHFRPALTRELTVNPEILIERRDLLTRLLEMYRETKA